MSNTGWTSVGELLMTRRISLVAVCCSSASVRSRLRASQLLEQPHVLDGDDRLVGERAKQLDLRVAELARLRPTERDGADRAALAEHRYPEQRAEAGRQRRVLDPVFLVGQDVRDVDDRAVTNGARRAARAARAHGERVPQGIDSRRRSSR